MKKILIALICLILVSNTFSQNPYYDAIKLSGYIDPGTIPPKFINSSNLDDTTSEKQMLEYCEIINGYYNNKFKTPNQVHQGVAYFSKANPDFNPFLAPYLSAGGVQTNKDFKGMGKSVSSGLSSLGSIDVTNFANGVSLFLIERAKQELNIAFFQKFTNFVEKNPEIRILFPNTSASLSNLLAYQYSQMLPVLQDAFYKDMQKLPNNLIEVTLLSDNYKYLKDFPEFIVVFRSISLLQKIDYLTPPQLIDSLPTIAKDTAKYKDLKNLYSSLKLASIFSNSIRTDSNDYNDSLKNYWITSKVFYNNVLNRPETFNIFMGLLYQEIKTNKIVFNNKPVYASIDAKSNDIFWYKTQYIELLDHANNISTSAQQIQEYNKLSKKPTNQDIYTYVSATINVFDFAYQFMLHYSPQTPKMDKYIALANSANNLYINAVNEKYSLAMNNAINIIATISEADTNNSLTNKSIFNSKTIEGITTYGTFIANMADADSPQEVQAAIETAALPAGSSSFKKNYRNNIALNAYLGANMGNWSKDKSSSKTWNNDFRLTAPIGIAWTPFSFGKGGSLSLFASVLDVGAIVSYQLVNDTTVDQKIYLSNIFSPGGYIVYGMAGNIPLSFGFGAQYGPGLMKIGDNLWDPSLRWNFFITFDIPIFNLNKGKGITK